VVIKTYIFELYASYCVFIIVIYNVVLFVTCLLLILVYAAVFAFCFRLPLR